MDVTNIHVSQIIQMDVLQESLFLALNSQDTKNENIKPKILMNHTEIYWFFQEVEKLLVGESSLGRFFYLIQHGKDAVWRPDDPLPFLALNFLQIPWLLLVSIVNGNPWNKINFCLGQVL